MMAAGRRITKIGPVHFDLPSGAVVVELQHHIEDEHGSSAPVEIRNFPCSWGEFMAEVSSGERKAVEAVVARSAEIAKAVERTRIGRTKAPPEEPVPVPVAVSGPDPAPVPVPAKKKGFWARLFGRK